MKPTRLIFLWLALFALIAAAQSAFGQGTNFTYQGVLNVSGQPATGNYDFQFRLAADPLGATVIGNPYLTNDIPVSGGLFTVAVTFGSGTFTGSNYWLEIGVRTNGGGGYQELSPLQSLTPAPYAIFANTASNLSGTLPTGQLNGTLSNGQLAHNSITVTAGAGLSGGGAAALGGSVSLTNAGVLSVTGNADITAATTAGAVTLGDTGASSPTPNTLVKRDGSGNFSAGTITANLAGNATTATNVTGKIADAQLSANVALLYGTNAFTGTNILEGVTIATNANNAIAGNGSGLTSLNAASLTSIGNTNGGSDNFFAGFAGNAAMTGSDNTAFGFQAFFNNTNGADNSAFGLGALFGNTSGRQNTAAGFGALNINTTGSGNTAIGFDALHGNMTGSDNTGIGYQALDGNTSGSNNIALGYLAGENITTGGGNIDIGNIGISTDTNIIRIGAGQSQAYIAGVLNGNGGGVTNLNAANLTGILHVSQLPAAVITNEAASVTIDGTNVVAPLTIPPNIPAAAIGSITTDPDPVSIAVAGRYAYVVNKSGSALQVFDVSTPSAPVSIGSASTLGGSTAIAVAGRYAYVANSDNEFPTLQVFDVSNPSAPVSRGAPMTGGPFGGPFPTSVAVAGRYAYVANNASSVDGNLDVFDLSEPGLAGTVSTGLLSDPNCVAVAGGYAYLVNQGSNTMQIIDVSVPSAPVSVSITSTGANSEPTALAVAGRYAYVVCEGTGILQVFDVSNPLAPVSAGSVPAGSEPASVEVAGRYAYVGNYGSVTLQVFDVSAPSAPVSVGALSVGPLPPNSIAVAGRYAYVVAGAPFTGFLQIYDLGGAYVQQMEAGTIETGTLQTRDTVTAGNNLNVRGGLTVGASARISGGLSVDNGTIRATNFTGNGAGLTSLSASQLTGALPAINGASLTNLPAGNLTGSLPAINGASLTALPANAALLNATQTFTATNIFSHAVGIVSTSPEGLLEIQGGGEATGANDQHDIALAYYQGGYRHWIRSRHNTTAVDNAIDFFVNTNGSSTASSAPGVGNVLVMSLNGGNVGIANAEPTHLLVVGSAGSPAYCDGTTWQNGSDRNSKEAFAAIDPGAVLEKVSALPITEWKYKVEADGARHIGPMAQDFHAAFGLNGGDDTHIATIDEEGVALAAIQGLNTRVEAQAAQLKEKDAQIDALKQRLDAIEKLIRDSKSK